eukprot:5823446-Amphidinium_carterae.1
MESRLTRKYQSTLFVHPLEDYRGLREEAWVYLQGIYGGGSLGKHVSKTQSVPAAPVKPRTWPKRVRK